MLHVAIAPLRASFTLQREGCERVIEYRKISWQRLLSRLDVLLNHLLKRCYIPKAENHRGWELTIREQRKEIQRLLKQSPTLRNYLSEIFDEVWKVALAEVQEDYNEHFFQLPVWLIPLVVS